jgi:hypothetical protein
MTRLPPPTRKLWGGPFKPSFGVSGVAADPNRSVSSRAKLRDLQSFGPNEFVIPTGAYPLFFKPALNAQEVVDGSGLSGTTNEQLRSRNRRLVVLKAGLGHTAPCLGILHECLPHEAGSRILRHEHGDAGVDAHNVLVIPFI